MNEIGVRAAALLVADDKLLLVNHRKGGRSYWVLPGGHVRPGEPLPDALRREMKEELDLDVTVGPLLIVHDFIRGERHVVNNVFRVETASTDVHVTPEKVLKDARWVPLDELESVDLLPPIGAELRRIVSDPTVRNLYLGRR